MNWARDGASRFGRDGYRRVRRRSWFGRTRLGRTKAWSSFQMQVVDRLLGRSWDQYVVVHGTALVGTGPTRPGTPRYPGDPRVPKLVIADIDRSGGITAALSLLDRGRMAFEAGEHERALAASARSCLTAGEALMQRQVGRPLPEDGEPVVDALAEIDPKAAMLVAEALEVSSLFVDSWEPDAELRFPPGSAWEVTESEARDGLDKARIAVAYLSAILEATA